MTTNFIAELREMHAKHSPDDISWYDDHELQSTLRNSLDLWLELADALDQFFTKSYIPTHRENVMLVNNYNQRALPQVEKAFLKLRGEG